MRTVAAVHQAYEEGLSSPDAVADAFLSASPTSAPWHAFRAVDEDDLRRQAAVSTSRLAAGGSRGRLEGVLVGVKDFLAVRGYRSYGGTKDLVAHGEEDALVVSRLRAAGALIAGKTHTTELGLNPTGVTISRGAPVNPHASGHLTGGSSSGTGAAVAAGLTPVGVGSDGGGSIRIPAALCGVYGIKPSWNLVPTDGEVSVGWWSVEHVGPLATCTSDLALMLEVMADVSLTLSAEPLRYGVDWGWWGQPDPDVDAACRAVVGELDPTSVTVPAIELAPIAGYVTALSELGAGVWDIWRQTPGRLGVDVRASLAQTASITGVDYVRAQQVRRLLAGGFDAVFDSVDVIVVPTTSTPAPERPTDGEMAGGIIDMDAIDAMTAYTFPANLCGLPAASVPVGTAADGRPIGLQLIGRRGADDVVLSACAALERAGLAASPTPPRLHHALTT